MLSFVLNFTQPPSLGGHQAAVMEKQQDPQQQAFTHGEKEISQKLPLARRDYWAGTQPRMGKALAPCSGCRPRLRRQAREEQEAAQAQILVRKRCMPEFLWPIKSCCMSGSPAKGSQRRCGTYRASQARNGNLLLARPLLTKHPAGSFLHPWPTVQSHVLYLDPVHIPHAYSTSHHPSTQRSQAPSFLGPHSAKVTQIERQQILHLNF